VNNKVKAFYKKHRVKINLTALALTAAGLIALSIKSIESVDDDLTEEEWDHLIDLARGMDEYVAERKALKNK